MFEYRVTKYDPAQRDPDGAYRRDEWTSFSDIGKSFGGQMFTAESYAQTEQAYLTTVDNFCAEAPIHYLTIVGLENYGDYRTTLFELREGGIVAQSEIQEAVRCLLREQFWCRLEDGKIRFVHVGYDYYLYVGVPSPCSESIRIAHSRGLFVEKYESPYRLVSA